MQLSAKSDLINVTLFVLAGNCIIRRLQGAVGVGGRPYIVQSNGILFRSNLGALDCLSLAQWPYQYRTPQSEIW